MPFHADRSTYLPPNTQAKFAKKAGGDEAALFVRDLVAVYQRFASRCNWRFEPMHSAPTEQGGFKEVVFALRGENVFHHMQFESGGHRVQRVPETEARGRVHTSAATVAVLAEAEEVEVHVDTKHERADIVLKRPPLNVISMPQREVMRQVFEALDAHDGVRVIVLRSEGEHFSSGGDIKGFLEASPEHVSKLAWNVAAPVRCEKPVIAVNRGYTFGVGFELSLACDFRIASETTLYALPEQNLGQIPGSGGSARLQKIIGITRTKHMVMRAKRISGAQALEWGIATECVADDQLEAATQSLVDELRRFSPLAQRTAKKLINDNEDAPLAVAIEMEGHCYSRLRSSQDFREGVEAFHAKRKAIFRGE